MNQHQNRDDILRNIAKEFPGTDIKSQIKRMAVALTRMGSITTFEAMRKLDIYDPRPRKLELLAMGFDIALTWDRTETESGVKHRIGRYVLKSIPEGWTI